MGDWATTHHWFECESPALAHATLGRLRRIAGHYPWPDRERWALRAGLCAPQVVLAASLCKYGAELGLAARVCAGAAGVRALQVCADYNIASADAGLVALEPRFNYVHLPAGVAGKEAAAWLGDGVRLVQDAAGSVLCLREPAQLPGGGSARVSEMLASGAMLARVVEALLLGAWGSRRVRMLLGLRTPMHGWLHRASLTLVLGGREPGEYALRHDGGGFQVVTGEFSAGPMAGSLDFERAAAVDLSRLAWPFA